MPYVCTYESDLGFEQPAYPVTINTVPSVPTGLISLNDISNFLPPTLLAAYAPIDRATRCRITGLIERQLILTINNISYQLTFPFKGNTDSYFLSILELRNLTPEVSWRIKGEQIQESMVNLAVQSFI